MSENEVEHRSFVGVAAFLWLVVFVGVARTYFLKRLFVRADLPPMLQLHGGVMTAWFGLFVVQVGLIGKGRPGVHRVLGWAGAVLAVLVAVTGAVVSIGFARHELAVAPGSAEPFTLLTLQLIGMVSSFLLLVGLGFVYRGRKDVHKRLMVLAMLAVLGPAVTRLPFLPNHNVMVAALALVFCVLVTVVADWVAQGKIHPTYGWGAPGVVVVVVLCEFLARQQFWQEFLRHTVL